MADQKTQAPAEERLYTIPLRSEWLKVPKNRRAKRSMSTIRSFLSRHMKVPDKDIKLSSKLNEEVWTRGAGKPPSRVRIKASLDPKEGTLFAGLPDEKPPEPKSESKKTGTPEGKASPSPADTSEPKETKTKEEVLEKVREAADKATSKEAVKEAVEEAVAAESQPTPSPEDAKTEPQPDTKTEKPAKETKKEEKKETKKTAAEKK